MHNKKNTLFRTGSKPNQEKIERDKFHETNVIDLKGFDSVMGLQFENLVLNNTKYVLEALSLSLNEIEMDGPFFQRGTKSHKGCQADYMIQTKYKTLYLIEIKFSRNKLEQTVISEVQHKIDALKKPKNTVVLPVIIHISGVSEKIIDADYFYRIIDFTDFLYQAVS